MGDNLEVQVSYELGSGNVLVMDGNNNIISNGYKHQTLQTKIPKQGDEEPMKVIRLVSSV